MPFFLPCAAAAFDFKTVGTHPVVLYDAPSVKGGKLFIAPSGMPVEVVLSYGDWVKVRDAAGDLAWTETSDGRSKVQTAVAHW